MRKLRQMNLSELSRLIAAHTPREGRNATAIAELSLSRAQNKSCKISRIYEPCLCLIAQGQKRIFLDKRVYIYSPSHYLLVSAELPLSGQVIEAEADRPYYGLQIRLDLNKIRALLPLMQPPLTPQARPRQAVATGKVNAPLSEAAARLLRLLDAPQHIAALAPLILREIHYWLLRGEYGSYLAHISMPESHAGRIGEAIKRIKEGLDRPIKIEDLARDAAMSVSSFHAHFKELTALSPLQYQKQLRLNEARRIMLSAEASAAEAAFAVGYESASQFNREYARLYGLPPKHDIARLREGG